MLASTAKVTARCAGARCAGERGTWQLLQFALACAVQPCPVCVCVTHCGQLWDVSQVSREGIRERSINQAIRQTVISCQSTAADQLQMLPQLRLRGI